MKIYLAGFNSREEKVCPSLYRIARRGILISYFYMNGENQSTVDKENHKIILDSGAFSALTTGKPIILEDYISYLHDNARKFKYYFNLDVIGDEKKTWQNMKELELSGFSPLPVAHFGESDESVQKAFEYEYFGVGAMVGAPLKPLVNFLDKLFKKKPKDCKVHALGITNDFLLRRYQWHSSDSARWIMEAVSGKIMVPTSRRSGFDYSAINLLHWTDFTRLNSAKFYRHHIESILENFDIKERSHRIFCNAYFLKNYEKTFKKAN